MSHYSIWASKDFAKKMLLWVMRVLRVVCFENLCLFECCHSTKQGVKAICSSIFLLWAEVLKWDKLKVRWFCVRWSGVWTLVVGCAAFFV